MANYKDSDIYKKAKQGDAYAMSSVGVYFGIGMNDFPKNEKQAFIWVKRAADQGLAHAQYNLGFMYQRGMGVEKNFEKAAELYRKAASQEDADAQASLGLLYHEGTGVKKNYKKASEFYLKAAKQGHARAQYELGNMYLEGTVIE